jgi:hypothetical protein
LGFDPGTCRIQAECSSRGHPGSWLGFLARGRETSEFFE